jgi:hypothetical protein
MGWILLEALVALLLAVFIVWFTMGGRRSEPRPDKPVQKEREERDARGDGST